jgi:hypothetical protein
LVYCKQKRINKLDAGIRNVPDCRVGTKTEFNIKKSQKNFDTSDLFDNSEFEDHIAMCASFAKLTNSQSMGLRKRIVEILELIEQELKK